MEWCGNSLIETDIILLHSAPVSPPEAHLRGPRKDLEHLPRKGRHHPLEGLVAGVEGRVERAVVLVGLNDRVVSADVEHVLAALRGSAIDGEGVVGYVDCAPVFELGLVGRLDLPVFDQFFDEVWEGAGGVVCFLGCLEKLSVR